MIIKIQTNLGVIPKAKLTLKEDGNIFTAYLPDMADGKYVPDMVKEQEAIDAKLVEDTKIAKQEQLDTLIVESNTVPFDADNTSINYMSSILSVANFKYNQLVASGMSSTATYDTIYKTVIKWKNANNTVSDVQLETVAEALELAMNNVGSIKTNG